MIQRYVDTASAAGGDGTTTATSGANRAFSTVREAIDSLPATLTDQTTITCAASTGAADTGDLGQAPWDFATSATNYLLIEAAAAHRATLTGWDTSRYRIEGTDRSTGVIYLNEGSHVRFDGLQVKVTCTTGSTVGVKLMNANQGEADIDCRFTNGRVLGVETGGTIIGLHSRPHTGGAGMAYFWNNVVTGCNQGAECDSADASFYNNTFYGNNFNMVADAAFLAVNNVCAAGISGDFIGTFHASSNYNASSDTSAPGANSRVSQVFGFVNPGGGDFHLQSSDGGAKNFGTSDPSSGKFSDDMDRVTRTGSWDIGADELAVPTVALTGTATASITEADVVTGGKTVILTVTGDTVVPTTQVPTVGHIVSALGGTTSTTSFSITLPATLANDILILSFTHRGTGDGTLGGTTSLTFAKKFEQSYNGATFSGLVYWARATGNHAGETVSVSSLTNSCAGVLTVYRNVLASGDPFDGAATSVGEENASGNETQAEITTLVDGCMVILEVYNSPDVAVSTHVATNPATLLERAERLSTGGTDTSVSHASELRTTAGATGSFTWAQTNGAGGSLAYALQPQVTTPFADARAATRDGVDSAQAEGTGWDALKSTTMPVANVVRTSDTVITITLAAAGTYNITAQETITATVPATMLSSAQAVVASPTFTVATGGGGSVVKDLIGGFIPHAR